MLDEVHARRRKVLLEEIESRNGRWFDAQIGKLDCWAEDLRASLKVELAELDEALREAKKASRFASTLPGKLELQHEARVLETKRDEEWRSFDQASRDIDRQKDMLLDETAARLM